MLRRYRVGASKGQGARLNAAAATRAQGNARSDASARRVLAALDESLDQPVLSERNAHLLLALGYLGDPFRGDRLASALEGWNYRQEFRLQRCLASY